MPTTLPPPDPAPPGTNHNTLPQLRINGVDVTIAERHDGEGIKELWPEGGQPTAIVVFKCDWQHRAYVVAGLKGYTATAADGTFVRYPPLAYPDNPIMVCTGIDDIAGSKLRINPPSGWPYYEAAYITARFAVIPWSFEGYANQDPSGQPWTTSRLRSSGEVFAPPLGALRYTSGPNAGRPVEESSVGLMRAKMELSVTRRWLPQIPTAEIKAAQNTVNANPIAFGNDVFARGTVLFLTANTEPDVDGQGNVLQNVDYIMLANGDGIEWNQILDPGGTWAYVANAAGLPPFAYADFWNTLP